MKVSLCTGAGTKRLSVDKGIRPIVGFSSDYSGWFVRDKRDGVLVVWLPEENRLMSRSGGTYASPEWWRDLLPSFPIQGELVFKGVTGEDDFHSISGLARRKSPNGKWKDVVIAAFDLPDHSGTYRERTANLTRSLAEYPDAPVVEIPMRVVPSNEWLAAHANKRIAAGREGVVIYDPDAFYAPGKKGTMRKIVALHRAEAEIIKHRGGGGRHKGRLGAYIVRLLDNPKVRFAVGTGLKDADRDDPAPIGSIITVEYKDRDGGTPNQPVYKGVRSRRDMDEE